MIATVTFSGVEPLWALVVASVLSGGGGAILAYLGSRRLMPAQERQLETHAQLEAVQTVETALNVARARVDTLEALSRETTRNVSELTGRLVHEQADRQRISDQLNLALAERARLEQQIIDLNRILGARRVKDLSQVSVDAIVMVDLDSGAICYANEGVFTMLGYMPSALMGQPLSVLIPEGLRAEHNRHRSDYSKAPRTRPMGSGIDLRARRVDGIAIPVDISLHPTGDGRVLALMRQRDPASHPVAGLPVGELGDDASTSPLASEPLVAEAAS